MRWAKYVPVAERRAKASSKLAQLAKKKKFKVQPLGDVPRCIVKSFWGKKWCSHIEGFSDYDNRLPRGRTYVRNGSVCHLAIRKGKIDAKVTGSSLYDVKVEIKTLASETWTAIKEKCSGQIGSLLELLNGTISEEVMTVVTESDHGLLPRDSEISYDCSCPDWADMCKHVAAVLYGIGSRLDHDPEALFTLRGVNAEELIAQDLSLLGADSGEASIADDDLSELFGIDMEEAEAPSSKKKAPDSFTGAAIRKLRVSKGMSVSAFADTLGVSSASVARWEKVKGPVKLQAWSHESLSEIYEIA